MNSHDAQYQALTDGAGLLDFSDRTKIELTGTDRLTFLHNFCTNNVSQLAPGTGCEAFLTDVHGKIVAHVFVFCGESSLILDAVAGQAAKIAEHLDRYLIREDVQIDDRTEDWGELFLSGAEAPGMLRRLGTQDPPTQPLSHTPLSHTDVQIAEQAVVVRSVGLLGGNGLLIQCQCQAVAALTDSLLDAGATLCEAEAFDTARIEAGTPLFGRDITDANLPQEVDRNERTISFTKGCYLGQETVARIDALGHVNQTLCGVRFQGQVVPEIGTELMLDDKKVGRVTSATYSPQLAAPLALAYVRRGHNSVGAALSSSIGAAEVIQLPL